MKSPRWLSSSSPIGISSETGSWLILRISRTRSGVISISRAISSVVGSRPSSCCMRRLVRKRRLIVSTMCPGILIARAWSSIVRVIADQARTIRIPVHMVETINRLLRTSRRMQQELGREPTTDEIAREMEITPERVREILKISQDPVSLEMPIGEEEDSHLGDFIEDLKMPAPADAASRQLLREQVVEVLSTLSEREKDVLYMRYGLDDGRTRTLEEVGRHFGVNRARIRPIEAKALRKLRMPSRANILRDYLE